MEILYLLMVFLMSVHAATDTWTAKIKNYRPKSLVTAKMRKVAEMSDSKDELNNFKKLLKPLLTVRVPDTPEHTKVRQFIVAKMDEFGWTVEQNKFEDDTPYGVKTFTNIIATQDPRASRTLVIACHYDSKYFTDFKFVAATDSAVPCAMMLDMARLMKRSLEKHSEATADPEVSLQFMFFDGEEAFKQWTDTDSLYGARHLASRMKEHQVQVGREEYVSQIKTIDVLILLDLIGTKTTKFRNWFDDTSQLYQRFQKTEEKLEKSNLFENYDKSTKYFHNSLGPGSGIQDDHVPFLQKGVPIIHLISYPFPREWHKAEDNEKALDYPTINNIGKILRVFVYSYLHLHV